MKISVFTVFIFSIGIYANGVNSKNLKSYYGNSISHFKGQRKPLASPMGNGIDDNNYKRAKRQIPPAVLDFQQVLNNSKMECLRELNMNPKIYEKSLLYEENPTNEEKCLMMCILKKTKLMENSNKLSAKAITRIASAISEDNPLVVSIAEATASKCRSMIAAEEPCEAAYQINKCIGTELKGHKLKLFY